MKAVATEVQVEGWVAETQGETVEVERRVVEAKGEIVEWHWSRLYQAQGFPNQSGEFLPGHPLDLLAHCFRIALQDVDMVAISLERLMLVRGL